MVKAVSGRPLARAASGRRQAPSPPETAKERERPARKTGAFAQPAVPIDATAGDNI